MRCQIIYNREKSKEDVWEELVLYSAQEWFDNFYNKFIQTRRKDKAFGIRVTSGEYTQLMLKWLENLGTEQGFKVKRERLTIDQYWEHAQKGTVALEHEITARTTFKKELPNLMDIASDLKVLITYVYDYQFPWETDNIAEKIEKEINTKFVGKVNEFVLLIGTLTTRRFENDERIFMQRESDWFARKFYLGAVRKSVLVPSSSRKARKAWSTRRRES